MDEVKSSRNLQVALQERCRQHLRALTCCGEEAALDLRKRAKPYLIVTFLMMKHFLLNNNYSNTLHWDLNV